MSTHTISLITCAYNPSEEVFQKVLDAVSKLDRSNIEAEYIIVDNNSKTPLEQLNYVQRFLKENGWAKVVSEKEPGLTAARICGYNYSVADLLLFIDDDVELATDYLQNIVSLNEQMHSVGAWNAGVIQVKYMKAVKRWYFKKGRTYYQESDSNESLWGSAKTHKNYTPFGTGLCIKRNVFDTYYQKVKNQEYLLTDRIGTQTMSCGDTQIVHCALFLNYCIGRSHLLKLNHLVSEEKARISYLSKLQFGLEYSMQFFKKQSTPEVYQPINRIFKVFKIISYNTVSLIPYFDFRTYRITISGIIGACVADFRIQNRGIPFWLKAIAFVFKLDITGY